MYKIIFFDVDSTLYSHKTKSIPQSAIDAIQQAHNNGYKIGLATGRSKELTAQLGIFDVIHFDYFVTINGTLILDDQDKILYHQPCKPNAVQKVIDLVHQKNLNMVLINRDSYYLLKPEDKRCHLGYDPLHIQIPKVLPYQKEDIYQMNLFCEDEYIDEFYEATKKDLSYSKLDNYGYDVYAVGETKATGIKHLIDVLGIHQEETMAIGDGHNDEEMIRFVHMGIAMGNAIEKVKRASQYITDDIDHDGVYNALKHFHII